MYGPVTLEIDGEMKFSRPACGPPLAWAAPRGAGHPRLCQISGPKKSGPKKSKKKLKFLFFVAVSKTRPVFDFDHFFRRRSPGPLVPTLLVGGGLSTLPKFRGPISGPTKSGPKKSKKKLNFLFFVASSKTRPPFDFDHFFCRRSPSPLVPSLLVGGAFDSVKERMEAGRSKQEEVSRKK